MRCGDGIGYASGLAHGAELPTAGSGVSVIHIYSSNTVNQTITCC